MKDDLNRLHEHGWQVSNQKQVHASLGRTPKHAHNLTWARSDTGALSRRGRVHTHTCVPGSRCALAQAQAHAQARMHECAHIDIHTHNPSVFYTLSRFHGLRPSVPCLLIDQPASRAHELSRPLEVFNAIILPWILVFDCVMRLQQQHACRNSQPPEQ